MSLALSQRLQRWSLKHLIYRARLPSKRKRKRSQLCSDIAPYLARSPHHLEGPVVVVADRTNTHGLARAAQYEIQRLSATHSQLVIIDLGQALKERKRAALTPYALKEPASEIYLLTQPDNFGTALAHFNPNDISGAKRTALWVWENDVFPKSWQFVFDLVDEIWTPSEFSAQAFRRGSKLPIKILPHAVSVDKGLQALPRARFGVPDDSFLGLAIMDIQSCPERKNPWAHVTAWQRAFGTSSSHTLIMKIRFSNRTRIVHNELLRMIGAAKNIKIIDEMFSVEDMTRFQKMADVYLSLHRSEGYGLNIHEMLELGIPTVATNYSANIEYGPQYPHYFGADYRLVPYHDWLAHYEETDFEWAEADIDDAAAKLRMIANCRL